MPEHRSPLPVTAAVLLREGRVLLARRPPGDRLAGYWEFPGGKIESGESPEDCLARELREEFGIEARVGDFLARSLHRYPEREVELLAYRVEHLSGEFELRDHDAVRWVLPEEIVPAELAPADRPLVPEILSRLREFQVSRSSR